MYVNILVFSRRSRKTKKIGKKWKKPWTRLDYRRTKCEYTMKKMKLKFNRINIRTNIVIINVISRMISSVRQSLRLKIFSLSTKMSRPGLKSHSCSMTCKYIIHTYTHKHH